MHRIHTEVFVKDKAIEPKTYQCRGTSWGLLSVVEVGTVEKRGLKEKGMTKLVREWPLSPFFPILAG